MECLIHTGTKIIPRTYNVPLFPRRSPGLDYVVIPDQPGDPGRKAEKWGAHLKVHLEWGFRIPIQQVGILRHEESAGFPKLPSTDVLAKSPGLPGVLGGAPQKCLSS